MRNFFQYRLRDISFVAIVAAVEGLRRTEKMYIPEFLLKRLENLFKTNSNDPIDEEKNIISTIQKLVGIHNVFGDNDRHFTPLNFLCMLFFAGAHFYVGSASQLIYLVQVFPNKVECFKVLNCISAALVPFSKYVFMWTARPYLQTIFRVAREGLSSIPAGSPAEAVMLTTLNKARYASWWVVLSQGTSHVLYLAMPFIITVFGNERYLPTTPGDTYGLSPKYETPFYEISFTITALGTFFSAVNQTGYIVLFVILLAHELGHFYSITNTLDDINNTLTQANNIDERASIDEKIKFCIKHHQYLLKFHNNIREMYKTIFGAHFFMMTVVLVSTLQTLGQWDIRNTILTGLTGVLPLFIYCFGGELLISAGSELSLAIYASGWEFMEVRHAKMIRLMLCLSKRTLYLTAADIFVMSRETFGNVAQVVYKIYAVFN